MLAVIETVPQTQNLIGNFNGQNVKLRRITVGEYDAMIESGVFDENDQVELLKWSDCRKNAKRKQSFSRNRPYRQIF